MDFSLSEDQQALRDLARQIFADGPDEARRAELETRGEWFDEALWSKLAEAGLCSLAFPEEVGGAGFGVIELCLVLEELGRHLAPVPLLPTAVLGGLPIAVFGSSEQRMRWLPAVAESGRVLTAALQEPGGLDPVRPATSARADGAGFRLDGEKTCVPAGHRADCVLVPARTGDGEVGVFLVEPSAPGVTIEIQRTTSREPQARIQLRDTPVGPDGVLGDPRGGAELVAWIADHARVALAAVQLGLSEEALRRTAAYAGQRRQFGRPIAAFQTVAARLADAYTDVEAMRSTLLEASWRLSAGLPAELEAGVARWWACCGSSRVTHTAQHIHAGIGADVGYPIHRFFLWSKQLEMSLGGASPQLADLGARLVARAGGTP